MILQALNDYYNRKAKTGDSDLAPSGFEWKEIPFIIVLNEQGEFFDIEDYREIEGRRTKVKKFLVPQGVKKSVNIAANLLWGGIDYVLGIKKEGKEDRLQDQHNAFVEKIRKFASDLSDQKGIQSVLKFLDSRDFKKILEHPLGEEFYDSNPNVTFRLLGETQLVCQSEAIRQKIQTPEKNSSENPMASCLVTGKKEIWSRLHPAIKGVTGAQTSGANIVSFNKSAFCSYEKEQGENAPVGRSASFAYTTALNHLLGKDSCQKLQVGDATTVFWAEQPKHLMESLLEQLFGEPPKDDPDRGILAVKALYKAPETGAPPLVEDNTRFFVLGLSPNAARLSIRFWYATTVADLVRNIQKHFEDISIIHAPYEKGYPSLFRLLVSTSVQGKSENILPNLAGVTMKSILEGTPYPRTLLSAVLTRARAEQAKKDKKGKPAPNVSHPRAALIKACLNRHSRRFQPHEKEVAVSLDETNHNIGYLLGRLFAVLEKTQEEASPGLNTTIRDRFYGAASTRPAAVFPVLLKLKNHHVSKLENRGRATNLEKMIGGIVDGVQDIPSVLKLEEQGRFAIGYYHQRQKFFNKTEKKDKENNHGYSKPL